jgi:hypothetical protein
MFVSSSASDNIGLIQRATVVPLTDIQVGRIPSSSNLAFVPTRNDSDTDMYCFNGSTGHAKEAIFFRVITLRSDAR